MNAQELHDRFKRGEIGPADFRAAQAAKAQKRATTPKRIVDVVAFFKRHHILIGDLNEETNFTRYSITCPECGAKNAYVLQHHDGGVSMGCYHRSCKFSNQQDHWNDFARLYEPDSNVASAESPLVEAPPVGSAPPKKQRMPGVTELTIVPAPSVSGSKTDLLWGYAPSDVGNGQRFLAMHRDNVLCDDRRAKSRVWFVWDGMRWTETSEGVIRELAHQVGVEYVKQAAEWRSSNTDQEVAKAEEESLRKRAMYYLTTKGLNNAVTEAVPYVLAHIDDFDCKRALLNFTNGTLDLNPNPPELREHRREDHITRLIDYDYDPNAACPEFMRFLIVTMGGNPDGDDIALVKDKVHRLKLMFGSVLTGDVSEKKTDVLNGETDTGKTTLLQIVRGTMSEYSVTIPIETLMSKERSSAIEESLLSLRGKRFAITSETGRNHTLNAARLKLITQGVEGAEISVVPKYKPQISFSATHHLFMDCNFRPRIWGGDEALWNRLRITNFPHRVARQDQIRNLTQQLLKERQGIMALLVEGYIQYREAGSVPETAEEVERLRAWRSESERLHDFLEAYCLLEADWIGKDADGNEIPKPEPWAVAQNELWKNYSTWVATQTGEKRMKKTDFYGDIESLPGVKQGRPRLDGKPIDGFWGIRMK